MPTEALLTIGFIILSFVVAGFIARRVNRSMQPSEEMLESGLEGTAIVKAIAQTGTWINNNPQVRFLLEVHPPGDEVYQHEMNKVVQIIDVPRIQPGMELKVLIDPANREKVEIVL